MTYLAPLLQPSLGRCMTSGSLLLCSWRHVKGRQLFPPRSGSITPHARTWRHLARTTSCATSLTSSRSGSKSWACQISNFENRTITKGDTAIFVKPCLCDVLYRKVWGWGGGGVGGDKFECKENNSYKIGGSEKKMQSDIGSESHLSTVFGISLS